VRAAVYRGRGNVRIESVPEPGTPARDEVVISVGRAAICGTDASEWKHGPLLARPPVTLGHEFTGRVVEVGAGVEGFVVGDRVVSGAGISCGRCAQCRRGRTNLCSQYATLGLHLDGGLAELVSSPASICRPVPEGCSDVAASMTQPLAVALHATRRAGIEDGSTCVVIGVGGIGTFIVAAAVAHGATAVIAVDVDDRRLELARSVGANEAIDARGGDPLAALAELAGGGAGIVIEASGTPQGLELALAAADKGARVVLVGLQSGPRELDVFSLAVRELEVVGTLAHVCAVDLPEAVQLLATTRLAETVLDRVILLEELVDEGLRPLANGTARGKIVVDVSA